jgi:hypothetical protein
VLDVIEAVVDANWQAVVLILGVVGLSLATVCFAIWVTRRPEADERVAPARLPEKGSDEEPTEVHPEGWPTRQQH